MLSQNPCLSSLPAPTNGSKKSNNELFEFLTWTPRHLKEIKQARDRRRSLERENKRVPKLHIFTDFRENLFGIRLNAAVVRVSAIHWINQCGADREPRSGALMRMPGWLEVRSGWCFRAQHVKGVKNTLVDEISRWDRASIHSALRNCRPDIGWQEQDLGQAGASLCTRISASSTSGSQLRAGLNALTAQASGLG